MPKSEDINSAMFGAAELVNILGSIDEETINKGVRWLADNSEQMVELGIRFAGLAGDLVQVLSPTVQGIADEVVKDKEELDKINKFLSSAMDVGDIAVVEIRKLLAPLLG